MTVLGIDYGSKRVGVAVAFDGQTPERLEVAPNNEDLINHLAELVDEHGVERIAIGLPRNLDGDDTQQTKLVREFAAKLGSLIAVNVVLQDEADTSNIARERLKMAGKKFDEIESLVDAEAAVIILEDLIAAA
jgi:putative holliday junction resolvase